MAPSPPTVINFAGGVGVGTKVRMFLTFARSVLENIVLFCMVVFSLNCTSILFSSDKYSLQCPYVPYYFSKVNRLPRSPNDVRAFAYEAPPKLVTLEHIRAYTHAKDMCAV